MKGQQGKGEISNFDLYNITTLVKVELLNEMLVKTNYSECEHRYLVDGFTNGFNLHYKRPWDRKDSAKNIPFRGGIGSHAELWQKMLKETILGRFAGPFEEILSPILCNHQ